jgi:hypothetical protein
LLALSVGLEILKAFKYPSTQFTEGWYP